MTSDRVSITVAYHKSGPHPVNIDGYVAMCNVSPDGSKPRGFASYDDVSGFPDRNASYCELSPLRALSDDASTDYVGLAHYRRVFSIDPRYGKRSRQPGHRNIEQFDWSNLRQAGATADQLMSRVGAADWASPVPIDVRRWGFESAFKQFITFHGRTTLELCDKILAHMGMKVSLSAYLSATTTLRPFNMMIARTELLRRYTSFLWPILDECWGRVEPTPDAYQSRWPGFLAERLGNYWLDVVIPSLEIEEVRLPVLFLGTASIYNTDHPEQGVTAASFKHESIVASSLLKLPTSVIYPGLQLRHRSRDKFLHETLQLRRASDVE